MSITLREVSGNKDLKKFISFPDRLYKGNPFYVPPLHRAEKEILSPKHNPAFEFCKVKLWLAYDNQHQITGRIAAIFNERYNEKTGKKMLRFGWLDFVEDITVAETLLKAAEEWGKSLQAEYIHGPLGFLEFDPSGILVEGFDELPTAYGKYNYPYYPVFMEQLGYEKEVDWVEYQVPVPDQIPERILRMSELVSQRVGVEVMQFRSKKELLQYADEIFGLLNQEYDEIHGFYPLTTGQVDLLKRQFVPLIRLRYVCVVKNDQNQIVGFGICMPSLSRALQKCRGKLFPSGWFHILRALYRNDIIDTLLIAIDREYHNKGITSLIFAYIGKSIIEDGFKIIETTRELENNQNVQNLWNKLEHRQHKRSRCYIKKL